MIEVTCKAVYTIEMSLIILQKSMVNQCTVTRLQCAYVTNACVPVNTHESGTSVSFGIF